MPVNLQRLDQFIAESEARIAEQVLRIMAAEAEEGDSGRLRRALRALEGVLLESYRVRALAAGAAPRGGSGQA